MTGARKYAGLFKTGQYGRLYITSGSHARGDTFHIQVLPKGEKAKPNYDQQCLNSDAVVVYGVVGGNPGWTESYGWLHKGKWQEDFEKLYQDKLREKEEKENSDKKAAASKTKTDQDHTKELLSNY